MDPRKLLLSAALSGLLIGTACKTGAKSEGGSNEAAATTSSDVAMGECHGINACKGKGECGGKGHSCAGKNSCKGKGWVKADEATCKAKHGKFKKPKA